MGKIALTCVLALVFGFAGATGAATVFHDTFAGKQGPTGLTGATGLAGADGLDGVDGQDGRDGTRGSRGPRGLPGKRGKDAVAPVRATDLGSTRCAGRPVSVITDARISKGQQLQVTRRNVCIVGSPSSTQSVSAR